MGNWTCEGLQTVDVLDRLKWARWWFSELWAFIKAVYNVIVLPLSAHKNNLNLRLCTCRPLAGKSSEDLYGIRVVLICWEDSRGALCTVSAFRETWTTCTLLTLNLPARYIDKVNFACEQKPNSMQLCFPLVLYVLHLEYLYLLNIAVKSLLGAFALFCCFWVTD